MEKEIKMIKKNEVWDIVDNFPKKVFSRVKWVYKKKLSSDGSIQNLKVRPEVKRYYSQYFGVKNKKTFALVAQLNIRRAFITLAVHKR